MQHCLTIRSDVEEIKRMTEDPQYAWLSKELIPFGLEISRKQRNLGSQLFFTQKQIENTSHITDKIKLLQRAKRLSQRLKDSKLTEALTEQIEKLSPSLKKEYGTDEMFKVAQDLRRRRKFDEARKLYKKIANDPKRSLEDRVSALKGFRYTYKLEGARQEYYSQMNEISKFLERYLKKRKRISKSMRKIQYDIEIENVRSIWTMGDLKTSKELLVKIENGFSRFLPMSEVYWLQARIAEEENDLEKVIYWNEKAFKLEKTSSSRWETIAWQRAWNLRKVKRYDEAIELFEKLRDKTSSDFARNKYSFWLAKSLQANLQTKEAQKEFYKLIEDDILGYYGLLSYRELGVELPKLTSQPTTLEEKPSFMNAKEFEKLSWLITLGENQLAQAYIHQISSNIKFVKLSGKDQLLYLQLQMQAGDFKSMFEKTWALEKKQEALENNPEIFYPSPYEKEVTQASRKYHVPAALIYSIMRQESSFDSFARSPADAIGLLQLTPYAAKKIAAEYNIDYQGTESLYETGINIQLGTSLLHHLFKKFQNQMIVSVAAYNASEEAVKNWIKTRYHGDPLEFIEDIPYAETMGYVKTVLRNFIFYSRLQSQNETIAFPESCLEGLQAFKN